ncbi:endonuclease domain-containing protein [Devosia sp.]|uniref:endonuclease domain-containing protein n=1 Tax=Devosia sp. TaxID=1871048 RepID=UPI002FCB9C6B
MKTFARSMRHAPTEAERQLWLLLRNRRLVDFKFRRQVPIDHFIADFVCFSARLIVELDGGQHAESTYDTARDAYLRAQGFRILRIWNSDILARPDAVLDAVWAAPHEAQS